MFESGPPSKYSGFFALMAVWRGQRIHASLGMEGKNEIEPKRESLHGR